MSEGLKIRSKYPSRLPVLIYPENSKEPQLDKNKFLVPIELTISNLILVVRKRISVNKSQSLLFNIKKNKQIIIPSPDMLISSLYDKYVNDDGFLVINYSFEKTFG